jgi:predicted GNAT family N-acyltransferase
MPGFVQLDKSLHDRTAFDCGEEELNAFLKTKAVAHQSANISRTMVLAVDNNDTGKCTIKAFYTVSATTIERDTLPASSAKKLPHYPIPVFLLAQLAVDARCRGSGLGKITLICSLQYLYEVSKEMPANAVVVDCLNVQAEQFYLKYGFEELCEVNGRKRLYMPMKTVAELFSESV